MNPNISVIVPVYQAEKTIESCIESLLALKYPRDKLELIIVDNNSTDGTKEIIDMGLHRESVFWMQCTRAIAQRAIESDASQEDKERFQTQFRSLF